MEISGILVDDRQLKNAVDAKSRKKPETIGQSSPRLESRLSMTTIGDDALVRIRADVQANPQQPFGHRIAPIHRRNFGFPKSRRVFVACYCSSTDKVRPTILAARDRVARLALSLVGSRRRRSWERLVARRLAISIIEPARKVFTTFHRLAIDRRREVDLARCRGIGRDRRSGWHQSQADRR